MSAVAALRVILLNPGTQRVSSTSSRSPLGEQNVWSVLRNRPLLYGQRLRLCDLVGELAQGRFDVLLGHHQKLVRYSSSMPSDNLFAHRYW
eukprot:m.589947 g.589947  ORF g.589947 m.589947 type:complete len:91 (-) comp58009_c0_seq21:2570-2842(-)